MMRFEDMMREVLDGKTFFFPVFGTVDSFHIDSKTVDIRPGLTRDATAAPVLKKVPFLLPGAGGWLIDMTPSRGDLALVLFCGHNVFEWWTRSASGEQGNAALSDAVALVFAKSTGTASGITLRNAAGTMQFKVTDTDVKVTTVAGSVSLLTHTHPSPAGGSTGAPTPVP